MVTTTPARSVDLRSLLCQAQERLFSATDTVCLERVRLVTEAWKRHAHQPLSLRRAHAFAHVLANLSIDTTSNPIFAGNTSSAPRAWTVNPEFGFGVDIQVLIEHDGFSPAWVAQRVPADIREFWADKSVGYTPGALGGVGHMALDLDRVVNEGLENVLHGIRAQQGGDESARLYRRAMELSVEAVLAWTDRLADAAEAALLNEKDPVLAACHRRVAEACRRVPRLPARNLFEGLQAIVLVHYAVILEGQGMSQSIGLVDRVLARFAAEAERDPEAAAQLASAFLLKITANSYQGRGSKTQAITLGGARADGTDVCNAVTLALLEAYARTPVADPAVFFRWHRAADPAAWTKCLALLSSGRSMPLLVNDHTVAPALEAATIARGDAWNYCIVGCNEVAVPGKCMTSAFSVTYPGVEIEELVKVLKSAPESFTSVENIVAAYRAHYAREIVAARPRRTAWIKDMAARAPFPFTSALCDGPAEKGADHLLAMPYAHLEGLFVRGTTNAINALAAIDQLVFQRREHTLAEVLAAVDRNDAAMLAKLAAAPKWGNDDERVDRFASLFHEARLGAINDAHAQLRGGPILVCHVIRSLHHLSGTPMPATPDGRAAYQPLADSIGAECGTAHEGPTAILNSVLKLDAVRFYGGIYNLNLTFSGNQATPEVLRAMCEAFFYDGGQELQINALSLGKLRAARANPESFPDLVVRIAGLNARFIELSTREQDEIVRRAEACA